MRFKKAIKNRCDLKTQLKMVAFLNEIGYYEKRERNEVSLYEVCSYHV